MVTFTQTFEEWRAEQQKLSKGERVTQLLTENHPLNHHDWTDLELKTISSAELAGFLYERSERLRQEFPTLGCLLAYVRHLKGECA